MDSADGIDHAPSFPPRGYRIPASCGEEAAAAPPGEESKWIPAFSGMTVVSPRRRTFSSGFPLGKPDPGLFAIALRYAASPLLRVRMVGASALARIFHRAMAWDLRMSDNVSWINNLHPSDREVPCRHSVHQDGFTFILSEDARSSPDSTADASLRTQAGRCFAIRTFAWA